MQLGDGCAEGSSELSFLLGSRQAVVLDGGSLQSLRQLCHFTTRRSRNGLHSTERLSQRDISLISSSDLVPLLLSGCGHSVERLGRALQFCVITIGLEFESGDYICHVLCVFEFFLDELIEHLVYIGGCLHHSGGAAIGKPVRTVNATSVTIAAGALVGTVVEEAEDEASFFA